MHSLEAVLPTLGSLTRVAEFPVLNQSAYIELKLSRVAMDTFLGLGSHPWENRATMGAKPLLFSVALFVLTVWVILIPLQIFSNYRKERGLARRLPPGPVKLPLVGSLLSLGGGSAVHQTFARLSEKYGPLMLLWLGTKGIVIVTNGEHAREVLKDQDKNFAHRPYTTTGKYLGFEFKGLSFATYNHHWRNIREIYSSTHLSRAHVSASGHIRERGMGRMLNNILLVHESDQLVDLSSILRTTVATTLLAMIFGQAHFGLDKLGELMTTMKSFVDLAGSLVLADVIPALRCWDVQGVYGKMEVVQQQVRSVIEKLLEEYRINTGVETGYVNSTKGCLADALLTRFQNSELTKDAITISIWENIIGGTEPESITLDWAMAELLRHPQFMRAAQDELDAVVGKERLVCESDIPSLPFLQCILKETFRLHPPAPLGVPHVNVDATTLGGYTIPADTIVLFNLWAMGRDPQVWETPLEFNPSRFAQSKVQPLGQHFELLPFSSGRRQCPGIHLAMVSSHLILATLLQCFEWTPSTGSELVDMRETNTTDGTFICRRQSANLCSVSPRLSRHFYGSKR